ncbi:MAG: hypothetical protein FWG30_12205 [Eubacteriaceae bacterium]|nr:hypothetical protein [Eubacteriaceae bacterium]
MSGRQLGIALGDIGVFCLAVEKVLADDFAGATFEYSELYSQYHPNGKLIYLLTMFDLVNYNEGDFHIACQKIKKYCRWIDSTHEEVVFGADLSYPTQEIDAAAIIPIAIEFKTLDKEGINIFTKSDKTPWYEGPTLLGAIRIQLNELYSNE